MGRLCFGTYHPALLKALDTKSKGKHKLTEMLFGLVTSNEKVTANREEFPSFDNRTTTCLLKFEINVPETIKDACNKTIVTSTAVLYFRDKIVPHVVSELTEDLIADLEYLIQSDYRVSKSAKQRLLSFSSEETLDEFLSSVFLYVVQKKNAIPDDEREQIAFDQAIEQIGFLKQMASRYPIPERIPVPSTPTSEEMAYIDAILDAYADAEGFESIMHDSLKNTKKYRTHLRQCRKDYYAAETIRRGVRDSFAETDDRHFEDFKNETFEGIFDVYNKEFANGFKRMEEVLIQAANLTLGRCYLGMFSHWVGANEKKGACHMLVNDKRLKWVACDE